MSLLRLAARQAFRTAVQSTRARWDGGTDEGNIGSDCFLPALKPKFRLNRSDPVFSFGSCFAQEVQYALATLGFQQPTMITEPPCRELFMETAGGKKHFWPLHFFHRFNPLSMLLELQNLLGESNAIQDGALLYETTDGTVLDCHYSPYFQLQSRDESLRRRVFIRDQLAGLPHAQAVILTLGLTEVWADRETGFFLNSHPPAGLNRAFDFELLSWRTVFETLSEVVDLLKKRASQTKIIITVSPIPLDTTFTGHDVAVATMHSKATLLSAARELAYAHDHVDYFPSYEMAMLSSRSSVWSEDKRHIQQSFVDRIMGHFVENYVSE